MKDSKNFEAAQSSGGNYPNRNSPRWEMSRGRLFLGGGNPRRKLS